jgi:hypothetical protein
MFLASLDRRSEDVRVLPVIITELEFGNMGKAIVPHREAEACGQTRAILRIAP